MARRRPAVIVGVVGTTLVCLVVAGAVLGPRLRSPEQAAADAAPPPASLVTVAAERRVLVEPVVLRGQVTAGPSVALLPPAAAVGEDSVVTKVSVHTGQKLAEGDVVIARADQPMFALVLPFPLYRDIGQEDRGVDVEAVQAALRRLGYPAPRTGVLDAPTQDAVNRMYAARGWVAPAGLKRSAVLVLDRPGRTVSAVHVAVGSVLTDQKAPIVSLDGQADFVSARASTEQARQLTVGQPATIFDDAGGQRAAATIGSVGTSVVTGADGSAGVEITLAFTGAALSGAGDRAVRVDIAATADTEPVLAVPLTAVLSRPDGSTFVTAVRADGTTVDRTVTTGRTAGGWVAVDPADPDGLAAGTAVVVGKDFR
ncbi:MAG TPA: peptidoglycan-binding protein [Actinophytocola sp.]|uniref:peptidoglycan-binding protein n=1 Tax=Actinophytocola sp. TaxID=1872138 RepID=UPI002DDD2FDC|nr:peptidoglycan-binding protein [Actinophytocola sp.]HEV2784581.1 peptidoglycan-binding protein [Actinophytocola sp.]